LNFRLGCRGGTKRFQSRRPDWALSYPLGAQLRHLSGTTAPSGCFPTSLVPASAQPLSSSALSCVPAAHAQQLMLLARVQSAPLLCSTAPEVCVQPPSTPKPRCSPLAVWKYQGLCAPYLHKHFRLQFSQCAFLSHTSRCAKSVPHDMTDR
jgi:hypothetical protein